MDSLSAFWLCYLLLFNSKLLDSSSAKHVNTAMLEKFPNKMSIVIPIEKRETNLEAICHQSCLANPICLSFNVIVVAALKFICEFFNIKMNLMEKKLIVSNSSDFYSINIYADCQEAHGKGVYSSGIVPLYLSNGAIRINGYCDMETADGGWTVLQRRQDGSVDFDLPREDYKTGFGDLFGEFWFGLEAMHEMTKSAGYTIRFDLWKGEDYRYAEYLNVRIGDETEFYEITFGSYSGTAGDSLPSGKKFTTKDLDLDGKDASNCARVHRSGWWWHTCHPVGLNSYISPGTCAWKGMVWQGFNGHCTLTKTEIKIRK